MRTIDATPHKPIPLGKTATSNTLTIRFDVTKWIESYPDGIITLSHKRPTDKNGRPVSYFTVEDGYGKWLISLADTAFAGDGECELCLKQGDSTIKSITYETTIEKSIAGTETEPPEPQQGWVDAVISSGVKAQEAVSRYPYIDPNTYHWMVWDIENEQFIDTKINSRGFSSTFQYSDISKRNSFLYEVWYNDIDYYNAYRYFKEHDDSFSGGCSSVRNGKYFGRKFDWYYDNEVEFIVNVPHIGNRYASFGIAAGLSEVTKSFVEQGKPDEIYSIIPFHITDGMNERGLVCNMNVVPTDYGVNTSMPTVSQEVEICSSMLVRYVIDHFDDAENAARFIREHMKVYFPNALHAKNYEVHLMIADPYKTYVVEFIGNQAFIFSVQNPYMTNFFLYGIHLNQDGTVYSPATQDSAHDAVRTNNITEHGSGLERYNIIATNYSLSNTESGMWNLLDVLNYSKSYPNHEGSADPIWYTEFVGENLTCDSNPSEFNTILSAASQAFLQRSRDNPITWHSVHSIVYNIEERSATLKVQEENASYDVKINLGSRFS